MARGRSRYQKGRVISTENGGWEIHYNVYLTDPKTGKPKRHHRSRVVGHARIVVITKVLTKQSSVGASPGTANSISNRG